MITILSRRVESNIGVAILKVKVTARSITKIVISNSSINCSDNAKDTLLLTKAYTGF